MNINIFGTQIGSLATGPLTGVSVNITGAQNWTGITNVSGYAKDVSGNSPLLRYGDYSVTASLSGYNSASSNFNVPATTSVSLTLVPILTTVEITVSE